jgi:hypothetical protein
MAYQGNIEDRIGAVIAFASKANIQPLHNEERLSSEALIPTGFPDLSSTYMYKSSSDSRRFIPVLDSLANLSISRAVHQVHAVGMRAIYLSDEQMTQTQLIIAGNNNVPTTTIAHLKFIWSAISKLSSLYAKSNSLSNEADSPPKTPRSRLPHEITKLEEEIWSKALRFSLAKIKHRFHKHFQQFKEIDVSGLHKDDPFAIVFRCLIILERRLFRPKDDINWTEIGKLFRILSANVDRAKQSYINIPTDFQLQRYLSKVVATPQDIKVLLAVARSPRCRKILQGSFEIISLQKSEPPTPPTSTIPKTGWEWRSLVDLVLEDRNENKASSDDVLERVDDIVHPHCSKMEECGLDVTDVIHCECRLALYFLRSDLLRPYSYIGVSKLSCRACGLFLKAVNRVFRSNFMTKGCHLKWYYPWRFPEFPRRGEVAGAMYQELCEVFSRSYHGFRTKRKRALSDSDAHSGSGDDSDDWGDWCEYLEAEVAKEAARKRSRKRSRK